MRRMPVWGLAALSMAGCVHGPIDELGPSFQTVRLIQAAQFPPVGLGEFVAAPDQVRFARRINIRGSTMSPPKGSDFPTFLKQTMQAELAASGRFDPSAPVTISAEMTRNSAGENMSTGKAQIAATFVIRKKGEVLFSKNYQVESQWKSQFIGALAIPEAFQQYNALYAELVRNAFADPHFVAALTR